MDKKKLTSQVAQPVNKLPVQDTAIKLVELSDEALSQVYGGGAIFTRQPYYLSAPDLDPSRDPEVFDNWVF